MVTLTKVDRGADIGGEAAAAMLVGGVVADRDRRRRGDGGAESPAA
jgi:hypothetical protein